VQYIFTNHGDTNLVPVLYFA